MDVILASKSPYRKKLLEEYNIPFEMMDCGADTTPDLKKNLLEQLRDIALRKAMGAVKKTKDRGERIIVAADQVIVFEGSVLGYPKSIEEAKSMILSMRGSNQIYSYVGNAILHVDEDQVKRKFNNSSTARMKMENISDYQVDGYLAKTNSLLKCAGINLSDTNFLHLESGFYSTACGMTVEYLRNFIYIVTSEKH